MHSNFTILLAGIVATVLASACASPAPSTSPPSLEAPRSKTSVEKNAEVPSASTPPEEVQRAAIRAVNARRSVIDAAAFQCARDNICKMPMKLPALVEVARVGERDGGVLSRAIAATKIDASVAMVSQNSGVLLTEELGLGGVARFQLADLWPRLVGLSGEGRERVLNGAHNALAEKLIRAGAAYGVVDRVTMVGARVGLSTSRLAQIAAQAVEMSSLRTRALKLSPGDIPAAYRRGSAQTAIRQLAGPLFRGTPASVKGRVTACFVVVKNASEGLYVSGSWTQSAGPARSGVEQEQRIRAAACAAEIVRQAARNTEAFVVDTIWVQALSRLALDNAPYASLGSNAAAARATRRLLQFRRAALSTSLALKEGSLSVDDFDRAATTWSSPDSKVVRGAGALLELDPGGRSAEVLLAFLLSSAIEHVLVVEHGMSWTRRGREGESLQTLDRLHRVYLAGGVDAVFEEVGEPQASAALFMTSYDVMIGRAHGTD